MHRDYDPERLERIVSIIGIALVTVVGVTIPIMLALEAAPG